MKKRGVPGWCRMALLGLVFIGIGGIVEAQRYDPQMVYASRIDQIAPNPYHPEKGPLQITYVIVHPGDVELAIFSLDGREIVVLRKEALTAGKYVGTWDGRAADGSALPSGTYLCRLRVGKLTRTANIVMAR